MSKKAKVKVIYNGGPLDGKVDIASLNVVSRWLMLRDATNPDFPKGKLTFVTAKATGSVYERTGRRLFTYAGPKAVS